MICESSMSRSIHSTIKRLVNVLRNRELCTYTISIYIREIIQSSHFHYILARNKSFYPQYKGTLGYFKISLRSDSITSWLLFASIFYKCKRFHECHAIINYSLSRSTLDKIHLEFENSLVEQTVFKESKHKYGLLLAIKHMTIVDVFFKHPFYLLPDELKPSIFHQIFIIPPVVYSYLLQFLCYHHLGNYRGKQNALHDLDLTISERYFILDNGRILKTVNASLDIVNALL